MTFSTRVRRTYLSVRRVKAECSARSYTEQESVLSAATCNLCAVAGVSRSARLVCIPSKNFSNNVGCGSAGLGRVGLGKQWFGESR